MRSGEKSNNQYIDLNVNGLRHTVLLVGYTSDCGFFMSNVRHDGGNHIIFENWMPLDQWYKVGLHFSKREKRPYLTKFIPKLIHHRDGKAQVSSGGNGGIRSGFYKFFKIGKGVYTKSYDLIEVNNDGGPTMVSMIWGLNHFPYKPSKDSILFDESIIFQDSVVQDKYGEMCYVIEAYYVPKKIDKDRLYITNVPASLRLENGMILGYRAKQETQIEKFNPGDVIPLFHPVYGEIKGKLVPSPKNSPGYLILTCKLSKVFDGFKEHSYGHQISGAPSYVSKNGCKNILIQYPHTVFPKEFVLKAKSLDFGRIDWIKSKVDDFLNALFH